MVPSINMKSLLISWIITAASLLVVSFVMPGFHVAGITSALIAAVVIGLVNATIGLLVKIVTFPISVITLGLFLLVINALMLMLSARIVEGFVISGFWAAFFGSIVLSLVNSLLSSTFNEKK